MNIIEALEYVRTNRGEHTGEGERIVGVAYVPGDTDGEFQLFELIHQSPENEDEYAYLAYFQCGSLFSSSGTEEIYGGDTLEELIAEMPDLAQRLNYQIISSEKTLNDMTAESWLCEIYPQLPNYGEIETDRAAFRASVISLISDCGNSFQHESSLTDN